MNDDVDVGRNNGGHGGRNNGGHGFMNNEQQSKVLSLAQQEEFNQLFKTSLQKCLRNFCPTSSQGPPLKVINVINVGSE